MELIEMIEDILSIKLKPYQVDYLLRIANFKGTVRLFPKRGTGRTIVLGSDSAILIPDVFIPIYILYMKTKNGKEIGGEFE